MNINRISARHLLSAAAQRLEGHPLQGVVAALAEALKKEITDGKKWSDRSDRSNRYLADLPENLK